MCGQLGWSSGETRNVVTESVRGKFPRSSSRTLRAMRRRRVRSAPTAGARMLDPLGAGSRFPLRSLGPGAPGVCLRVRRSRRVRSRCVRCSSDACPENVICDHERPDRTGVRLLLLPNLPQTVHLTARSSREAYLPAQGSPPLPQARLPAPHVRSSRPGHREGSPPQGPSASVGLITGRRGIDRISEREVFRRFRGSSERSRHGCLQVIRLPSSWRRGRSAGSGVRDLTQSGKRSGTEPNPTTAPGSGRTLAATGELVQRVVPGDRLAGCGRVDHDHSA